jgi:hypothetical protein
VTNQRWKLSETPGRATKRRARSYCITLRSRTDETITGWYAGRNTRWSTDHKRQKRFDDPGDASTVCHELRSLCPRNAKVINIEVAQEEPHLGQVMPEFSLRGRG